MSSIYHCTITLDRYAGTYSGARWTAWQCWPAGIPAAVVGSDNDCASFWSTADRSKIGFGSTPEAAIADLRRKV